MYELWLDSTNDPVLRHIQYNTGWYPYYGLADTLERFSSATSAWSWPPTEQPTTFVATFDSVEEYFTDYPEFLI